MIHLPFLILLPLFAPLVLSVATGSSLQEMGQIEMPMSLETTVGQPFVMGEEVIATIQKGIRDLAEEPAQVEASTPVVVPTPVAAPELVEEEEDEEIYDEDTGDYGC